MVGGATPVGPVSGHYFLNSACRKAALVLLGDDDPNAAPDLYIAKRVN
jgi:hypothetical protein